MITRKHTEAAGVQPSGPCGRMELRQMIAVADRGGSSRLTKEATRLRRAASPS